jgi:hypothetical protein
MIKSWLMTVQEVGIPSLARVHWPSGVEYHLTPVWIASDPDVGDEAPPQSQSLRHFAALALTRRRRNPST